MEPVTIIIITVIIATVIFAWRTGFWKWLNYKPTPPPPEPEPETDLDVTTNLSEEQRLLRNWLGVVVAEQRKTASQAFIISHALDRIRGHLVFYTIMIILGFIFWFLVGVYIG